MCRLNTVAIFRQPSILRNSVFSCGRRALVAYYVRMDSDSMTHDRPLALGERLPQVRLQTADGEEVALSTLFGRPLVVVCVRYYG